MIQLIFISICGFLAYLCSELEEWTNRGHNFAIWPNSNEAWTAKYHYPLQKPQSKWYYLWFYKPKNRERFIYSSTLLVWITDGEHLFQFLKYRSIEAAFLIIGWQYLIAFLIGEIIARIIKELFIKQLD
jgi:hypothetical protein